MRELYVYSTNLQNAEMNVTLYSRKDYDSERRRRLQEKQTQTKPIREARPKAAARRKGGGTDLQETSSHSLSLRAERSNLKCADAFSRSYRKRLPRPCRPHNDIWGGFL
jgi:hypothetical protein